MCKSSGSVVGDLSQTDRKHINSFQAFNDAVCIRSQATEARMCEEGVIRVGSVYVLRAL